VLAKTLVALLLALAIRSDGKIIVAGGAFGATDRDLALTLVRALP
jgi:hypothetical protein